MDYTDYITVAATVATAAATVVIAVLTFFLFWENRTLRKAGASPELVAYLSPHPDGHGGIEFVLANIGRGPAFEVTFEFLYDEADFRAHEVLVVNDKERMPISVIPQDAQQRALFGVSFVLYGRIGDKTIEPLKPFQVRVRYSDIFGRKQTRERMIDIRQFAGLRGVLGKSNAYKISQSLESINKHLGTISKRAANLSTFIDSTEIKNDYVQKIKGNPPTEES